MSGAKPFAKSDLDQLGLSTFTDYLVNNGWRIRYLPPSKPGTYVYFKEKVNLFFCDDSYSDWYIRFAEAIADLAAFEGKSLVQMYSQLMIGRVHTFPS